MIQLAQFLLWALFILFLIWLIRKGINRTIEDNPLRYRAKNVVDYKKQCMTRDRIYQDIRQAIELTGGNVKLASATFEIVGAPDLYVTVDDGIQG